MEELAEVAAAELKRIEATDEDYDTPGDGQGGTRVTVVNDDGTVEMIETSHGGEASEVPPLTPFRVCTASVPLLPQHPYESTPASCPRLFCVLPSRHAKPRPEGVWALQSAVSVRWCKLFRCFMGDQLCHQVWWNEKCWVVASLRRITGAGIRSSCIYSVSGAVVIG